MKESVRELLDQVEGVPDFSGVKLNDINDTNSFGDNALHCICVWGDLDAAKLLVENGINIEQKGEGGIKPIKMADDHGHHKIVSYLISQGADSEALQDEFKFDAKANSQHLKKLREGIEALEKKIESECGKNA